MLNIQGRRKRWELVDGDESVDSDKKRLWRKAFEEQELRSYSESRLSRYIPSDIFDGQKVLFLRHFFYEAHLGRSPRENKEEQRLA